MPSAAAGFLYPRARFNIDKLPIEDSTRRSSTRFPPRIANRVLDRILAVERLGLMDLILCEILQGRGKLSDTRPVQISQVRDF